MANEWSMFSAAVLCFRFCEGINNPKSVIRNFAAVVILVTHR